MGVPRKSNCWRGLLEHAVLYHLYIWNVSYTIPIQREWKPIQRSQRNLSHKYVTKLNEDVIFFFVKEFSVYWIIWMKKLKLHKHWDQDWAVWVCVCVGVVCIIYDFICLWMWELNFIVIEEARANAYFLLSSFCFCTKLSGFCWQIIKTFMYVDFHYLVILLWLWRLKISIT